MRLSSKVSLVIILAASFAASGQLAAKPSGKAPAKPDLTAVSTEDLITRLQEVPGQYLETERWMGATDFVCTSKFLRFGQGTMFGPPLDIMIELVRRGSDAVPILLDHLSDARPTKMRLGPDPQSQPVKCRYGVEYDPRDPDLNHFPPDVTRLWAPAGNAETFENYALVIGDLCYVALGQIVNRDLLASYEPPQDPSIVINSPVRSPALAAAARADWSGLTKDSLKQSLIDDVQRAGNDDEESQPGLKRLLFYYPDDGKALVVQLLNRPLFNEVPKYPFAPEDIYDVEDEKEQDRLLEEFRRKNGEKVFWLAVQGIILTANQTVEYPGESYAEEYRKDVQRVANAKAIVARRFAGINKHPRATDLDTFCDCQQTILEQVSDLQSREIDWAARDLLKRTLELQPVTLKDKLGQCGLAFACMERLVLPAFRRTLKKEFDGLNDFVPPRDSDIKASRAYFGRCDHFLEKWSKRLSPAHTREKPSRAL